MAWTTPRTWVAAEVVTASMMNTHVRDNTAALGGYDKNTNTVDVTNTTTETSLYSYSIAGNQIGASGSFRATIIGDSVYNSSTANYTLRIKFGGVTWFAGTTNSTNIGSVRQPWIMVIHVANLGATNSQYMSGFRLTKGANGGAPTTGIGEDGMASSVGDMRGGVYGINGTGTVDTTANATFDVTVQWGTATTNLSYRKRYAVIELLP